jgi:hypothetical protein
MIFSFLHGAGILLRMDGFAKGLKKSLLYRIRIFIKTANIAGEAVPAVRDYLIA